MKLPNYFIGDKFFEEYNYEIECSDWLFKKRLLSIKFIGDVLIFKKEIMK